MRIDVFNMLGQRVRRLVDEVVTEGDHDVVWDGSDSGGRVLASGTYLYRVQIGEFVETKQMILLK